VSDSSADRDPLDRLAEEFVARLRRGEHPAVSEYVERHPDLADQVYGWATEAPPTHHLRPDRRGQTGPRLRNAGMNPPKWTRPPPYFRAINDRTE
jgi:hypothetical protein